ncbi:MAG: chemotaxis protein CheB [Campylobacter sp.]|nr:chemotaxis protein CheB [Campylobacter sp.]
MEKKLVLIGASTGGPGHIKKILKNLKLNGGTVVIAQHMNKIFIPSFATQAGKECGVEVEILREKTNLQSKVYVCEQNFMLNPTMPLVAIPQDDELTTFSPNVNMLFSSSIGVSKNVSILAVLLTGIGDDGASGLFELYKTGAMCIAESEESSIVYGMPKRAKDLNPAVKVLNLDDIVKEVQEFLDDVSQ